MSKDYTSILLLGGIGAGAFLLANSGILKGLGAAASGVGGVVAGVGADVTKIADTATNFLTAPFVLGTNLINSIPNLALGASQGGVGQPSASIPAGGWQNLAINDGVTSDANSNNWISLIPNNNSIWAGVSNLAVNGGQTSDGISNLTDFGNEIQGFLWSA